MPAVQCGWAKGGAQRPRDEPKEEHGSVYKSWITETLKMFIVVLASPAAFGIYCYLVNESVLAF